MFNRWREARVEAVVEELKKAPNCVILVGSAVSARPPTRLPMIGPAMTGVLAGLGSLLRQRAVPLGEELETGLERVAATIKFELFFAVLSDYFGSAPVQLASAIYSRRVPNANHRALARLSKMGHSIVTTNFDENIEACLDEAVRSRILHLHGRASDPDSMVLTLSKLNDRSRPELESVRRLLAECEWIVCVGYSGFGDVDILPILQEVSPAKILWFDRRGFHPPTKSSAYSHDLLTNDWNALILWSELRESIDPAPANEEAQLPIEELAASYFQSQSTSTIMRALASVSHEARFGKLGLHLYEALATIEGPSAVSNHEWAVAYERAGRPVEAAHELDQAARQATGIEQAQLRAGQAFCLRQAGELTGAVALYAEAREVFSAEGANRYSDADQILRGRASAYAKLAARRIRRHDRAALVDDSGVKADLDLLRRHADKYGERPGRLALLLELDALELDILTSRSPRELGQRARELWDAAVRNQDLEIEAHAARLAAAAEPPMGIGPAVRTLLRIRLKGASTRDTPKLFGAIVLALLPLLPVGWRLIDPITTVKQLLSPRRG